LGHLKSLLAVGKIAIGKNEYGSKKAAIAHYRSILNSYDFGQPLNGVDFYDLIDLLNYSPFENEMPEAPSDNPIYISEIKVSRVQFNTKCFEIFYEDGTSCYISYLLYINGKSYSDADMFIKACRSAIRTDIHAVKSRYFKGTVNRMAACMETGALSRWDELVVDHRQPNTFSVIVDRFKELYQIEPEALEYERDEKNNVVFADASLADKFREYHRTKANLRIVRRERNSSRNGLARVKRTNKDLIINN
jgi:hypothetical protein